MASHTKVLLLITVVFLWFCWAECEHSRLHLRGTSHLRVQPPEQRSNLLRLRGGKKAKGPVRKVLEVFDHEIHSKHEGQGGNIHVEVVKDGGQIHCDITSTVPGQLWMHWGFAKADSGWYSPPEKYIPESSKRIDDKAHQSPFKDGKISLTIEEGEAPEAVAFVLKKDGPEEWFNGPGGDFWIAIKPADANAVGGIIIDRETKSSHWSILNRMRLVNEQVKAVAESPDGLAWVYTLLRFNQMKLVPLSKNSNYQSKDLAHTQDGVSKAFAALYGREPKARVWARMSMSIIPRGGGNGDAIRLEILDIMRRHGIKEGHRPGIEDKFIEEWHQKLHTNCAPDDIIIAEAYIRFLETGNIDDYWNHLKGNGLSWEYMASIGGGKGSANSGLAGLTANPMHLPQLTDDIKHLRWTIMLVHGGSDIDYMITKAGSMDDELKGLLSEIQGNRHEWWIPEKIIQARRKLAGYLENEYGHRDGLMLDVALENWFKVQIEKTNFGDLPRDQLLDMAVLVLENAALSYGGEFWGCLHQFNRLRGEGDRWSENWGRIGKATVERTVLALQDLMDQIHVLVQPKARMLGEAMGTDEAYLTNFGEEVVRGLPSFCLSQIMACLDPQMRDCGSLGIWEKVSGGDEASGSVTVMDDLIGVQGQKYDSPQVFLVRKITGIEDIPEGVTAIVTCSAMDVLSHIAIRARNQGVLVATCHDEGVFNDLCFWTGDATVSFNAEGSVEMKEGMLASPSASALSQGDLSLTKPSPYHRMVVTDAVFDENILGGKSNNLQKLRSAYSLPEFVKFPSSIALPFGTCEKVLDDPVNQDVKMSIDMLQLKLSDEPQANIQALEEIREAFAGLQMPAELEGELKEACQEAGIPTELVDSDVESCYSAIKQVWASKWTERAFLSRKARNVAHDCLTMGVLIQQVLPAQYSFVLHTKHPVSGNDDEIMGELVVGLGEALVGNYPGRALTFTVSKLSGMVTLCRFPSKRAGLFLEDETLIFRSDSNGEDLEGFAGAGLYESIMAEEARNGCVDYHEERVVWDSGFRDDLLSKLGTTAQAVEEAMGCAQDIEGVVVNDDVYIVQTRPQV